MITYEPLRELMKNRGLSFRDLRRDCGITSNVAKALNNDLPVRTDVLEALCKFFDVPIDSIIQHIPDGE